MRLKALQIGLFSLSYGSISENCITEDNICRCALANQRNVSLKSSLLYVVRIRSTSPRAEVVQQEPWIFLKVSAIETLILMARQRNYFLQLSLSKQQQLAPNSLEKILRMLLICSCLLVQETEESDARARYTWKMLLRREWSLVTLRKYDGKYIQEDVCYRASGSYQNSSIFSLKGQFVIDSSKVRHLERYRNRPDTFYPFLSLKNIILRQQTDTPRHQGRKFDRKVLMCLRNSQQLAYPGQSLISSSTDLSISRTIRRLPGSYRFSGSNTTCLGLRASVYSSGSLILGRERAKNHCKWTISSGKSSRVLRDKLTISFMKFMLAGRNSLHLVWRSTFMKIQIIFLQTFSLTDSIFCLYYTRCSSVQASICFSIQLGSQLVYFLPLIALSRSEQATRKKFWLLVKAWRHSSRLAGLPTKAFRVDW